MIGDPNGEGLFSMTMPDLLTMGITGMSHPLGMSCLMYFVQIEVYGKLRIAKKCIPFKEMNIECR